MKSINFNGQIFQEEEALLFASNRAFNYGDGIFETMRVHQQKIVFFDQHWKRLNESMMALGMEWEKEVSPEQFHQECLKIYSGTEEYRIRATIWRAGQGRYTPTKNNVNFIITGTPLQHPPYLLNEKGLTLGTYTKIPVPSHPCSWIKTTQCLPYIQASLHKQKHGWDDCLLINAHGNLVEATSANLFLIKQNQLICPPLSEGGVAGVIRKTLLDQAPLFGFKPKEKVITKDLIHSAEEVFLTNSISGIRWVNNYENTIFDHQKIKQLCKRLSEFARQSK